jgi:hypothetical protein
MCCVVPELVGGDAWSVVSRTMRFRRMSYGCLACLYPETMVRARWLYAVLNLPFEAVRSATDANWVSVPGCPAARTWLSRMGADHPSPHSPST